VVTVGVHHAQPGAPLAPARLRTTALGGGQVRPHGQHREDERHGIKLLPWQLAHVAVVRIILGSDEPVTIGVSYALSLLIPVASITMAWRDPLHRALHDRVAGTRVVSA
jgi:hypothetical protein